MTLEGEIARRGRVAVLVALALGVISTCADLWLRAPSAALALDAVQLGGMGAAIWALSRPGGWLRPTAVLVAAALLNYLSVAAWAVVVGDPQTAILAFTAIALVTAVIIPWGAVPQAMTIAGGGAGMVGMAIALGAPALGYPGIMAAGLLASSVYIAREVGHSRRIIEEQNTAVRESTRHYTELIASVRAIVWRADPATFRFHFVSREAEKILGYPVARWTEEPGFWVEHIHPEDRDATVALCAKATRERQPHRFEYRMIAADGREVWLEDVVQVVVEDDEPRELIGVMLDVTERHAAQESLRRSEAGFRRIVEASPDPITINSHPDGRSLSVNRAFEDLVGYTAEEVLGRRPAEIGTFARPEQLQDFVAGISKHGAVHDLEIDIRKKDGGILPSLMSAVIIDFGGKPAVVAFIRDFTRRKQIEADSERARVAAIEASRVKSNFLASMSHEIRTPLNGVIGMTGLLLDTDLGSEQREYAEAVRNAADSLLALINDILDFTKVEAGMLSIEPIPFDLEVAAEQVLELLMPPAEKKGLDLALRYPSGTPRRVVGDAGRIRQVLTNLVGNAIKFTHQGQVSIAIAYDTGAGKVPSFRFAIEDSGIGIPAEKHTHVFERFTQADSSTTRRYGGTGLGLAISKQLVGLMGGEIGVRSRPGAGSTFWFTLPLALDDRPESGAGSLPDLAVLDGLRCLVADDNEVNRKIAEEMLRSAGLRVASVASGAEVLAALRDAVALPDPFQVAVLDYQMPGLDGMALARLIRADPAIAGTVLLLLTSGARRGDGKRMADAGFNAYLPKPVRPSVLLQAIAVAWVSRERGAEAPLITRHSLSEMKTNTSAVATSYGARVLLAEDNVINQRVGRLMLEKLGCRVDTAANGFEAVDMVQQLPYDLVFMDCQMPEMNGFEATTEIRRREAGARRLPIVAMTANVLEGDRERCLEAGMDDYLPKPVQRERLRRALEQWAPSTKDAAVRAHPASVDRLTAR